MFFDKPETDYVYEELLKKIARKQRQLFSYRFDLSNTLVFVQPKKEDVCADTKLRYEKLLGELSELKLQVKKYCKEQGYYQGNIWWNLPWQQVEESLFNELQEEKEAGKWRYAHQWNAVREKDMYILFLREEGHFSDFSSRQVSWTEQESAYSAASQMEMVEKQKKRIRSYELSDILWNSDDPVRSVKTNKIYKSRSAYYNSLEYKFDKDFYLSCYERSLYTLHKTTGVQAMSNSRHYDSIFAVAEYHIGENGTLDYIHLLDFEICDHSKNVPSYVISRYQGKDPLITCAAYLAADTRVGHVPIQLFGKNITEEAVDYDEVVRQAKLYTCLADKLEVK